VLLPVDDAFADHRHEAVADFGEDLDGFGLGDGAALFDQVA
jgi:hypothetical protein